MGWILSSAEGVTITVRVVPRASKTCVVGVTGDALKLRVQAPPVDGKANDAVVGLLAETLGIARSRVLVVRGGTGRMKAVRIEGIDTATVRERLRA